MMKGLMWLAMALGVGAPATAQTVPPLQPGETLLEVSATGEAQGTPDIAEVSTGVTADGATGSLVSPTVNA